MKSRRAYLMYFGFIFVCYSTAEQANTVDVLEWHKGTELVAELMRVFDKKIEKLEKSEKNLKASIGTLISTNVQLRIDMEEMSKKHADLERELKDQITYLSGQIDYLKLSDSEKGEKLLQLQQGKDTCEKEDDESCKSTSPEEQPEGEVFQDVRKAIVNHAFTAYLDTPIQASSANAAVIYNRVLLNEGDAYDVQTGFFTARITGMYLFSWAVATTREDGDPVANIWVGLMVNGKPQVGTVVGGRTDTGDDQTSSSAVLRLTEGDAVWTTQSSNKARIHGADNERTTSFMGVLLHPVQ